MRVITTNRGSGAIRDSTASSTGFKDNGWDCRACGPVGAVAVATAAAEPEDARATWSAEVGAGEVEAVEEVAAKVGVAMEGVVVAGDSEAVFGEVNFCDNSYVL